jgi:hypothetical protein
MSISDYITSTDRVICRQQTQRIWKRSAVAMLEIYRPERNDGKLKVFNYYSRCPGRHLNPGLLNKKKNAIHSILIPI